MLTKVNSYDLPWDLIYGYKNIEFITYLVEDCELNIRLTLNITLNEYYRIVKRGLNILKAVITRSNFKLMESAMELINVNYVIDATAY